MNRKEAAEILPIIKAFSEGKEIQYKSRGSWFSAENIMFIGGEQRFRIKPEPNYRPFNNKEECWKEMLRHNPLGWFKDKKAKEFFTLNCISDKDPKIKTYEYLFNDCVFMDGSICGVIVEE